MSKVKDTVTKINVKGNHSLRRIIFNYLKIIKVYERKAIGTYYSEHFLSFLRALILHTDFEQVLLVYKRRVVHCFPGRGLHSTEHQFQPRLPGSLHLHDTGSRHICCRQIKIQADATWW